LSPELKNLLKHLFFKLDNNFTYNSDEELIKGCLQNNRQAQEMLYKTFADKMFAVCKHYASDRHQACDFLQDGFITVFKKLDHFKFNGSLEGWIRRIIVNTALQELRKKKEFFESIDDVNVESSDFESQEMEDKSISAKEVIRLVNLLPKKAGAILKLYAIEGYSHLQIADCLDISIGTSKSQLNRARHLLKVEFNKIQ